MAAARLPQRPPLFSIALVSAAALACEVLLVRLFSIIQWHHYAYMIISLALLGYGASGAFLVMLRERLLRAPARAYIANLLLFSVASLGCFLLAQRIGFNPEEILWSPAQWLRLFAMYLLLALPFFFAANAIALMLMCYGASSGKVYGADLAGAGGGSLIIVLLLFAAWPLAALQWIALAGVLAAALACLELGVAIRLRPVLATAVALGLLVALAQRGGLLISPYKDLVQVLRIPATEVVQQRSSPLGLISVVESPQVPFRHAPGLSLNALAEPPPQIGLFTDADGPSVITRYADDNAALAYLGYSSSALAYRVHRPQRVLVLGAGGGSQVLQARVLGADHIDAVELNPQIIDLVRQDYAGFSGNLYGLDGIEVHTQEARGFLNRSAGRWDLIQLALLDTSSASGSGLYSLSENYLYTVEALQLYLRRLSPGGMLSITSWVRVPPRDTLKLFATAVAALRAQGDSDPAGRLVLIRSWQTSTLLIKNGVFDASEIEAVKRFCRERSFDTAWFPGMEAALANRYNILEPPLIHDAVVALLGDDSEAFMERFKYNLQPATDDRPYFFHFFKWHSLPEFLSLRGRGGTALLDTGYLVLLATLLQAALAGVVLIVVPLRVLRRRAAAEADRPLRVLVYFVALGIAFLFIEIAFIQKFILFLNHPLYAAAVVLAGFLIFAGLGSRVSGARPFIGRDGRFGKAVRLPVAMILSLCLVYLAGLDAVFRYAAAMADAWRIALSLVLIAPLAFFMGMPFAQGLQALAGSTPAQVPWAWGINGCASVISAVLATLIAIEGGFTLVVVIAMLLYLLAAYSFPRERTQ